MTLPSMNPPRLDQMSISYWPQGPNTEEGAAGQFVSGPSLIFII